MAADDPVATKCVEDLIARVMQLPEFVEKCEFVRSEQDLKQVLQGARYPMAGVIYDGMLPTGNDPSRQGMAADLSCTVLIIVAGSVIGGLDQKREGIRLLDVVRNHIRLTKSPTYFKWRFGGENLVGAVGNSLVYRQRWVTPVVLTASHPPLPP